MRSTLIIGNWKMNGKSRNLAEVDKLLDGLNGQSCDLVLCPPATLIAQMAAAVKGSPIQVGGQDCHWNSMGPHTGDISPEMITDAGGEYVILGHSERRSDHGESDSIVNAKCVAALAAGLTCIVCVGETKADRSAENTLSVIENQLHASIPENVHLSKLVVAYEPVWAIGTGLTPTISEISDVHTFMRRKLIERFGDEACSVPLAYGGSVNADNAPEILAQSNVSGVLVGGASLRAEDFLKIVSCAA